MPLHLSTAFSEIDVAPRRDLWSKTPGRREQLYEPSCCVCATCWGEVVERGIAAQRGWGCHPWLCSWDTVGQRVKDAAMNKAIKICLREASLRILNSLCWRRSLTLFVSVEWGGKGQATFLGVFRAFEVEEGQLGCQRHREAINNRRREQDARTPQIFPQHFEC